MKTRLTIILFVLLGLLSPSLKAQEKPLSKTDFQKNEFNLGYGMLTGPEVASAMSFTMFSLIGIGILRDTVKSINPSAYGIVSLNYLRYLAPWVSVGASASINPITMSIKSTHGYDFDYSMYLLSIMPRVNFYYYNHKWMALYSGVEAGVSLDVYNNRSGNGHSISSGAGFAFHVNAFGFRMGKEIGGFMEFGYGFRGVVNFGISARL